MDISAKRTWQLIILSLIIWAVIFTCIPKVFFDPGGDSAQYIILSESMNQGKWFKAINLPGEPYYFYYPPVLPILLFPIIHFFGRNFLLMNMLMASLGYLSLFFIYKLLRSYSDKFTAVLITSLFATNFVFIYYSTSAILSDIPYLFMSCFGLLFAYKYHNIDRAINREYAILLLALVLSYFTRYIGITLFLGIIAALILSLKKYRLRKAAFVFLGFLLIFLLWKAVTKFSNPHNSGLHFNQFLLIDPYRPFLGDIMSQPGYLVTRFIEGANYNYLLIGQALSFYSIARWKLFAEVFYFSAFVLVLLGFLSEFRKNKDCVFQYYFLIYFTLIIFWPYKEGVRLILPILPFILFYFFSGIKAVFNFINRNITLQAVAAIAFIFLIFNIINLTHISKFLPSKLDEFPEAYQNFIGINNWIESNLRDGAFIISRKPTLTNFYTGHKSACYPFSLKPEEIWQYIDNGGFRYIIIDEFSWQSYHYLAPFIREYKDRLKLLKRIGNTGVFEVSG